MAYRDDRDALMERLAALEGQVRRTEQLELRVRELEEENRRMRQAAQADGLASAVAAEVPAAVDTGAEAAIYVDDKIRDYVEAIVATTRSPQGSLGSAQLADYVLSGARPDDVGRVEAAARARAVEVGRGYVTPEDVVRTAPGVLGGRVVLTERAVQDGVTAEGVVVRILEQVEVP
jgi:MoxR-like ATPase